ncbi:MAG TPA: bifunctional hydroxymethylpyrimidine kinase/phosphomethylpyrimidine kinase [Candidatus Korarchaeota archaeon]|nr:bifunctional hydroxymethylpyrimidine kinase/phosphomethylpyrimidine kinase [Candidatus Korarchaeota archaeon]
MVWIPLADKIPVAMTIAGSDSGGGAGIQADLKTFAALGVHGTAAITAITAQNTVTVTGVQDIDVEIIRKQIEAVAEDIGIDAAKTGMLHTSEIIEVVAEEVKRYGFPLVVDPVMIAKSGAPLLEPEAMRTLIEVLLPLATVVTPNAKEAEKILQMRIKDIESAEEAARNIASMGPKAVVLKGGHLGGEFSIDVVYHDGRFELLKSLRIQTKNTHGTGCTFSAAIAAELAKGNSLLEAIRVAKEVVTAGIRFGIPLGSGHGPVNPMALLYKESEKWNVLNMVKIASEILQNAEIGHLTPEVGINVAMALPYAETPDDVAAIPGRLRKVGNRLRAAACPEFGASSHLSKYILEAMRHDPKVRAAINLTYRTDLIERLEKMGLLVSSYDRREEPTEVKRKEGATVPWGMRVAIEKVGKVPDVVYHLGDWGKEPMIVLLGSDPVKLAKILIYLGGV